MNAIQITHELIDESMNAGKTMQIAAWCHKLLDDVLVAEKFGRDSELLACARIARGYAARDLGWRMRKYRQASLDIADAILARQLRVRTPAPADDGGRDES